MSVNRLALFRVLLTGMALALSTGAAFAQNERLRAAEAALDSGEWRKAARLYEKALAEAPEADTAAWYNYGLVLNEEGRRRAAREAFRAYARRRPEDPDGPAMLGLTFQLDARTDSALRFYAEALRLAPKEARFHWLEGSCLQQRHDYAAAAEAYGQAVRFDSAEYAYYAYKADAFALAATDPDALLPRSDPPRFTRIHAANADKLPQWAADSSDRYPYAELLARWRAADTATNPAFGLDERLMLYYGQSLRPGYISRENAATALCDSLRGYLSAGEYDSCIQAAEHGLRADPLAVDVHYYLGLACFEKGRYAAFERALSRYRGFALALSATGDGKSPETAWMAFRPGDEYRIMEFSGLEEGREPPEMRYRNGRLLEVFELANDSGGLRTRYFDIHEAFRRFEGE